MTKSDCSYQRYALTTKSKGQEQIKVWYCIDAGTGQEYYFLDNGAECTELIYWENGEMWYVGGGWVEKLLGKSFKGTSKEVDKLCKWIIYIAIAIATLTIASPLIYNLFKQQKK